MLDSKGFDLWADGYDRSVGLADESSLYPFAGYKKVLGEIYSIIMEKPGAKVLDLGFGTGTLTARLYEQGCIIYGQDFSEKMIALASEKMPDAKLYAGDFSKGLVKPLLAEKYDFIIATYSLHHLDDEEKKSFLSVLLSLLNEDGKILIGDVAFNTREELDACRENEGDAWDEDEIYFVIDEMKKIYPKLRYYPKSYCAGVVVIDKK